jgi:hypothetical protein
MMKETCSQRERCGPLSLRCGSGGIEGDLKSKAIRVAYDASDTSPDAIEAAVTRLGHRVEKRWRIARCHGRSVA